MITSNTRNTSVFISQCDFVVFPFSFCIVHHQTVASAHFWLLLSFCVSETAVRFDSNAYLKYLHRMDEDNHDFKLSLRFKTFKEEGFIVSANGTDWGTLQVFISVTAFKKINTITQITGFYTQTDAACLFQLSWYTVLVLFCHRVAVLMLLV